MSSPGSSSSTTTAPVRPAPNAPFHPYADTATYRDLLLFEERLKMNAEMLRRRRRRYMVFLWTFLIATVVMAHHLLLTPPETLVYLRAYQGFLAVVLITLVLFFASGMYGEKIWYAHAYLTHSNKVLRPLNMHLNTRRPPLLSSLSAILPSFLRFAPSLSSASTGSNSVPPPVPSASAAAGSSAKSNKPTIRRQTTSTLMPTIPPSSNPRGELIFSSRVDRNFREGYERYRAAFERRREEKERMESVLRWRKRWSWLVWWWRVNAAEQGTSAGTGTGGAGSGHGSLRVSVSGGDKEKGGISGGMTPTPTPTPPGSRRSTPPPSMRIRERERSGSPSGLRNAFDPSVAGGAGGGAGGSAGGHGGGGGGSTGEKGTMGNATSTGGTAQNRERAESYSFVWTGNRDTGPLRRAP